MKETHIYKLTFKGKILKDYRAGKISVIDAISDALEIPQEDIEWLREEK